MLISFSGFEDTIALNNVQSVQYFLRRFNTSRSKESILDSKQKARNFIKETLDAQGYKTEFETFDTDGVSSLIGNVQRYQFVFEKGMLLELYNNKSSHFLKLFLSCFVSW